jgi:L-threonylcarbamoyladenylate synthase
MQHRLRKQTAAEPPAAELKGFSPEPNPQPEILECDPGNPQIEVVEKVADTLLEGRLVAFPMDTMYALAADATNPAAVERIRGAIESGGSKQFGALIHSMAQLKHLVKNVPENVARMLEELWPGPLTVVFDRHPHRFAHLSSEPTLGLRIPKDYLSLAILSTVGRPLAATSIRLEQGQGAKQVAEQLAGTADIVIDTRELAGDVTTTIFSVAEGIPRLLREGAVAAERIKKHLGDLQDAG